MAVVHVTYEANLQAYEKSLRETTDFTEKQIKKQVRAHGRMLKAIDKDAAAASKATQKAASDAGRAVTQNVGAMRKVFEGVQGPLGSTGARLTALGEAAAALGPAGAAGLAVAGFVAVLGLTALAAVKAAFAVAGLVRDAAEFADEAEDLRRWGADAFISQDAIDNVRAAALDLDNVDSSLGLLKITIASQFGPAVEDVTEDLVALTIAASSAVEALDVAGITEKWGQLAVVSQGVFKIFSKINPGAALLQGVMEGTADAIEDNTDEARKLITAMEGEQRIAKAQIIVDGLLADEKKRLATETRNATAASREAASAAAADKAMFDQMDADRQAANDADRDEEAAFLARQDRELAAFTKAGDEKVAADKDDKDLLEEQERNWARIKTQLLYEGIGAAAAVAERLGLDAFRAQQAGAVAGIVVDTIRAAMNWAASVPPPAVPAAIAAAVALGGIQSALVLSAPPPAYHVGGLLGQSSAPNVDETFRTLRDERTVGVVTPAGLNQLNRGEGAAARTLIIPMHGHKQYNAFMADDLAMSSSTTRRAIKSTRRGRVGHRRRNA